MGRSSSFVQSVQSTGVTCAVCDKMNIDYSEHSCYLPDPVDPSCFYACSDGDSYHMSCPSGLVWNDVIQTCDWPENVPTHAPYTKPDDFPTAGPTDSPNPCAGRCDLIDRNIFGVCFNLKPDESDPDSFYICVGDHPMHFHCPPF